MQRILALFSFFNLIMYYVSFLFHPAGGGGGGEYGWNSNRIKFYWKMKIDPELLITEWGA